MEQGRIAHLTFVHDPQCAGNRDITVFAASNGGNNVIVVQGNFPPYIHQEGEFAIPVAVKHAFDSVNPTLGHFTQRRMRLIALQTQDAFMDADYSILDIIP